MNKIKTDVDVLDWAKMISDGKGEKFVPLGKGDMYVIAGFVLRNAKCFECAPLDSPTAKAEQEEPSADKAVGVVSEDTSPIEVEQPAEDTSGSTSTLGNPATTKATMTRGYALHRAGFTTQQAYDKFLEWSKEHPKEGMVMDFSTGVKSVNAAFAYWLMETITLDIPKSYTTGYGL